MTQMMHQYGTTTRMADEDATMGQVGPTISAPKGWEAVRGSTGQWEPFQVTAKAVHWRRQIKTATHNPGL